jgi:hypothetical protein
VLLFDDAGTLSLGALSIDGLRDDTLWLWVGAFSDQAQVQARVVGGGGVPPWRVPPADKEIPIELLARKVAAAVAVAIEGNRLELKLAATVALTVEDEPGDW